MRRFLKAMLPLAALVGAAGCTDSAGELVIVVQTDLSLPKDIDAIRIEIFSDGVPKFKDDYERLGNEDQTILLPGTLTLLGPEDPASTVRIVVSAREDGKEGPLRIVREAYTSVPEDRVSTLQLPLQFLCDGSGKFEGDNPTSNCPEPGQTCLAGTCADANIDGATLPEYRANDVYVPGECFDVRVCFNEGSTVEVDTNDCSIPAVGDANIALQAEGDGICGGFGCFIALDGESTLGWQTRDDGRIQLPPVVCPKIADGTVVRVVSAPVTEACPAKQVSVPTCGPWSSAGGGDDTLTPIVLAGGQQNPVSVTVATSGLFWTNAGSFGGDGTIKAIEFLGGTPEAIATEQVPPRDVIADADGNVYWSIANETGNEGQIVRRQANGNVSPIVQAQSRPDGMALRGSKLFWTDNDDAGVIFSANLDGSGTTPIAQGYYPYRIVADDNFIYWTNEGKTGSMPPDGSIARYEHSAAAGGVEVLADLQSTPRGIVLDVGDTGDASAVYWTTFAENGAIMRIDLSGAAPGSPEVVIDNMARPNGIALDDTHVYWTNRGDGTVMRLPKGQIGGTPTVIASEQANPSTIVLDPTSLYWINESTSGQNDGSLLRLPKPVQP